MAAAKVALRLRAQAALGLSALPVVAVLAWAGGPLRDPDLWWHLRTGQLVLDSGRVPHTDPFSFTAPAGSWVPTAWLSDVAFAGVLNLGGLDAIRVLRLVLAAAVIVTISLLARRYAGGRRTAAMTTALAVVAVAPFLRERPQVLSLLFVAGLAVIVQRVHEGWTPPLWPLVGATYLWANVHGMWVLGPGLLLLTAMLALAQDRSRLPQAARCTTIALAAVAATLLTPAGPRITTWVLVVRDVAAPISEWQPTLPTSPVAVPFVVMLLVIIVGWALGPSRPVPARVAYVLLIAAFAMTAFRNLAPAAVLLVPATAQALSPLDRGSPQHTTRHLIEPIILLLGLTLAVLRMTTSPAVSTEQPVALAEILARWPSEVRVLNDYDVGGLVTGTASPPAKVAIDGRTDLWSAEFVRGYLDALSGRADWRPLVDRLSPDLALLRSDSEVARGLQRERAWRIVARDGSWLLLQRP